MTDQSSSNTVSANNDTRASQTEARLLLLSACLRSYRPDDRSLWKAIDHKIGNCSLHVLNALVDEKETSLLEARASIGDLVRTCNESLTPITPILNLLLDESADHPDFPEYLSGSFRSACWLWHVLTIKGEILPQHRTSTKMFLEAWTKRSQGGTDQDRLDDLASAFEGVVLGMTQSILGASDGTLKAFRKRLEAPEDQSPDRTSSKSPFEGSKLSMLERLGLQHPEL